MIHFEIDKDLYDNTKIENRIYDYQIIFENNSIMEIAKRAVIVEFKPVGVRIIGFKAEENFHQKEFLIPPIPSKSSYVITIPSMANQQGLIKISIK